MSAAFNGWSIGRTVHWPATFNRLVPLCVEGQARQADETPPDPGPESLTWYEAIPKGDAICDDEHLSLTCPDCIEWKRA